MGDNQVGHREDRRQRHVPGDVHPLARRDHGVLERSGRDDDGAGNRGHGLDDETKKSGRAKSETVPRVTNTTGAMMSSSQGGGSTGGPSNGVGRTDHPVDGRHVGRLQRRWAAVQIVVSEHPHWPPVPEGAPHALEPL